MKWTKCANLPVAMRYARATIINDDLFIGGGEHKTVNDIYYMFSYKLKDDQWMRLPLLPQCAGVPTNINNELCYTGGRDFSTGNSTNKVITLQCDQWIVKHSNMKTARYHHAVVSYQHYTFVAGGMGQHGSTLNTIEVFNCYNNQWTILSTHLPLPMSLINATTCNQSFIIAGYDGANGCNSSGTFIISMDSLIGADQQSLTSSTSNADNKWSELEPTPYWSAAFVPNISPPIIIGGTNRSKAVNKITLYDDSSGIWKTVSSLPISCSGVTVATINDVIIVAGGCTNDRTMEIANANTLTSVVLGQLELCD